MKARYIVFFSLLLLFASCSTTKNTGTSRWYHSFNTRFNVFFNGDVAYKEAMKSQQEGFKDNYSETLLMFPVSSLPKDKQTTGGAFDKTIEKSVKAIKTHSIQTKPEKKNGKRNDPKYKQFMSRIEYNPFLYHAWFLMAQSEFHNGDFLQASSTFAYISRLYASQPEISENALIWQARSYAELGWYYDAENVLSKIDSIKLAKKQNDLYSAVMADLLIKQKQYEKSIPYLQTAVKAEKDKTQKAREQFLLGQIYQTLGQNSLAYQTFGGISGANAPYILNFNAKIRQTEVYAGQNAGKAIKQLNKMAKSSKNKDYLDQVYYAIGNVYLSIPDTAKAIISYEKGVEESFSQGLEKALNQIRLGDIYFEQGKYVLAQPNYSGALSQLKKGDDAYPRVSKRSEVLDELVVHYEVLQLQDSLLRLSGMSEAERLVVVNKIIEDLIKKEKEEKEKAEREEFLAQQDENRNQQQQGRTPPLGTNAPIIPPSEQGLFYFYSPQVVAVGKTTFQQKWGKRKLEDDWRRRNKTGSMADAMAQNTETDTMNDALSESENLPGDSIEGGNTANELSTDPKDPQFYLQQIPVNEEDIEASNILIADALFNMGLIYKDKLEDTGLALETFNTLNNRYPENENKLLSYYHTYLVYYRLEDKEMAGLYKQKIIEEFPESEYAIAMADPDYEYNLIMMDIVQDSIYQQTYDAYLNADVDIVRSNYETVSTKYAQSKLMPKFLFLKALTYVQTNDPETFKEQLIFLINRYPDADVSVLASEMMKGFQKGFSLASGDGILANGSLFNMRFGAQTGEIANIDSISFSDQTKTPHKLLLIYPKGTTINDNLLLYTVAGYNFGNFKVNDFDLELLNEGEVNILQIKGFNSLDDVLLYFHKIHEQEGYATDLDKEIVLLPISLENYDILMKGKSLEEYMNFFEEQYGAENPYLVERWKLNRKIEEERLSEGTKEDEGKEDLKKEPVENKNTISPVEEKPVELAESNNETESNETGEESVDYPVVPKTNEADSLANEISVADLNAEIIEAQMDEIFDATSDKIDKVSAAFNEIAADPIRGIQNLFKKKKSNNPIDEYVKEQEKEEKERQKQLREDQKAKNKALLELAAQQEKEKKELQKNQEAEEKVLLKEKAKQEKELKASERAEEKAKVVEKKRIQKEKEDIRKQKKADQKIKAKELKKKEKQRKEAQKLKAKTQKEMQKQRAAEKAAAKKAKAKQKSNKK